MTAAIVTLVLSIIDQSLKLTNTMMAAATDAQKQDIMDRHNKIMDLVQKLIDKVAA